jgi:hypothetical protein
MKERKGRGIILLREGHLSESVRGGTGKFAIPIIAQHFLEVCPSARWALKISIAFAQRKIGVGSPRIPRVIVQIFLIFRDRQIVKFTSEKRVRIIELAAIGRFAFSRQRFGKLFQQSARHCWLLRRKGTGDWRLIHRPSPAHFGRLLSEGHARDQKRYCQSKRTDCASRCFHFAVAKATLEIPASVQTFRTPMMFL